MLRLAAISGERGARWLACDAASHIDGLAHPTIFRPHSTNDMGAEWLRLVQVVCVSSNETHLV
jgi:hypothetical protein